jgi:hypothetical protein
VRTEGERRFAANRWLVRIIWRWGSIVTWCRRFQLLDWFVVGCYVVCSRQFDARLMPEVHRLKLAVVEGYALVM